MKADSSMTCPCCGAPLQPGLCEWHRQCANCAYEGSTLGTAINQSGVRERIDESVRGNALRALRQANFAELLALIDPLLPSLPTGQARPRLLDVGAGHGWFVQAASARYEVTGIEPDEGVRAEAAAEGVALVAGYFPDCLRAEQRFEVITFNDSLEHIPDAHAALAAAQRHLVPGGLVVLNLPDARGLFYRLSRGLLRLGWRGPFERMWQLGLPSPHLHYFHSDNLGALARGATLAPVAQRALESLRLQGLYARIAYARRGARVSSALLWLAVLPLLPVVRWAPSDILVLVLRRA